MNVFTPAETAANYAAGRCPQDPAPFLKLLLLALPPER